MSVTVSITDQEGKTRMVEVGRGKDWAPALEVTKMGINGERETSQP